MGDNSAPHGGSGSADSYIGSRISLTSKSEIRYEGILYSIDTENSNIALQDVMSFGTEGRKKDGPQIPRSDKVYDFIIFRGSDIKDLQVISSPSSTAQSIPTPHNDPAIISQSQYTHAVPIASRFGAPPNGNVAVERSHPVPYPPSASSGNFRNVMPHMYQPWGLPPTLSGGDGNMGMPMYWPGYYVPPPPPPPLPLSTAPSSSSLPVQGSTSDLLSLLPPLLDDAAVASASLDLNALLLSPNSAPSSAPPNTVAPSVPSLSQSMPPLVSSSSSSSSTAATTTTTTSSSLSTVNSAMLPPTALKVAMPEQSSSEAPKPTKVINQEPLLPLPPTSLQERQYRQVNNGTLARSGYARRGRGRGRGGTALYQVKQFTEDFDFDAMNAKFKKFGVSEEPTDDAEDGGSNDEAQHDSRNASVVDPPEKPVYVKDDFFDSLSCAVLDRAASAERFKMSEQRKVDVETFGNFSSRFRAGGRGHRGGRRGGGSYYYGGRRGGIGRGNVYGRRGRGSAEHYS